MLKLINIKHSQFRVLKRISKFMQLVQSNWRQPRPKFDVTYAKFEFEFQEDLVTLKDREERDNHG